MKRSWIISAVASLTCIAAAPAALAQNGPPGTNVAVIDIGLVFKNHTAYQAQLDAIKQEIESYEEIFRTDRENIEAEAAKLETLQPGSRARNDLEQQLAQMQVNLNLRMQQKRQEILEREAAIRYEAYQEITSHVAAFCSTYGIQLVLRFSSEPIDPSNMQSIELGLRRLVVFHRERDITQHIITKVNEGPSTINNSARGPGSEGPQLPPR